MSKKPARMDIKSGTIFTGDNLPVLRGMPDESIDLIYLDPPFNSNHNYAAPIGSRAAGAEFKDTWTLDEIDNEWWGRIADEHPALYSVIYMAGEVGGNSSKAYCIYMAVRLLEMRRILKPDGSIFYHCDHHMSHCIKSMLDAIFGGKNFRNEIVWCYTGPGSPKMRQFNRKHDVMFWYAKGTKWTFNADAVRVPYADEQQTLRKRFGETFADPEQIEKYRERGKIPETWWYIRIAARSRKEYTGYPTQKPRALLDRIIKASSNKGEWVLDPFCGCATACLVAEQHERKWIGIDISPLAYDIIRTRLESELGKLTLKVIHRTDLPIREGKVSKNIKHVLYGAQQGDCAGCNEHFGFRHLEIDHITPRAKGGADDDANLQLLCGSCNRIKGDREMKYLIDYLRRNKIGRHRA